MKINDNILPTFYNVLISKTIQKLTKTDYIKSYGVKYLIIILNFKGVLTEN